MVKHTCNDPETGASACLEDGHDSSPELFKLVGLIPNYWIRNPPPRLPKIATRL